jgi:hypothetical protein
MEAVQIVASLIRCQDTFLQSSECRSDVPHKDAVLIAV